MQVNLYSGAGLPPGSGSIYNPSGSPQHAREASPSFQSRADRLKSSHFVPPLNIPSTGSQVIARRKIFSVSQASLGIQKMQKENEQLKILIQNSREERDLALTMNKLLLKKLYALSEGLNAINMSKYTK